MHGRHGGYRIGRSLQPPPLLFTASEALGLVMAVLDGHHAAADDADPVGAALGKLIRCLPEHTGRQAAAVRAHALAAPDRRAVRPDPTITGTLVEAVAGRRGVRISYTSRSGTSVETRADPWAVVVRHGRWYLLCFAHARNYAFRIDRIDAADILNVDFDSPDDLDPIAYLEQHLGSGWPYETCVATRRADRRHRTVHRDPHGTARPIDDTRCILHGTTNNPAMHAGEWLAPIPHPFRILGGPELRRAVRKTGDRLVSAATTDVAATGTR